MMKNNNFLKIYIGTLSLFLSSFSLSLDNGEFTYTIIDDGIEITGCANEICPQNMVIPSEIGGHTVVSIGDRAFEYKVINSVVFSDSITTIGVDAFSSSTLSEIDLPESLLKIEDGAFRYTNISSLVLPGSLESIGQQAFYGNPSFQYLKINSVNIIQRFNFENLNTSLLIFPSNLGLIDLYSFKYASIDNIIFLGNAPSIPNSQSEVAFKYASIGKIFFCSGSGWNNFTIRDIRAEYSNDCEIDTDEDGISNIADMDDDNDGLNDDIDLFPLLVSEYQDSDSDGLGDNADIDDDNDGIEDSFDALPNDASEYLDTDADGMGNNLDVDDDGDGVADVIDTFPLDPNESSDSDGDGVGDNADFFPNSAEYSLDSDLDQMPDAWERKYGLNPTDASDAVLDHDGDGLTALEEYEAGTIPLKILDIDANGSVDALTDALMVLRYLFGLRGQGLINGAIADNAMRTEAADVEAYIQSLMPDF